MIRVRAAFSLSRLPLVFTHPTSYPRPATCFQLRPALRHIAWPFKRLRTIHTQIQPEHRITPCAFDKVPDKLPAWWDDDDDDDDEEEAVGLQESPSDTLQADEVETAPGGGGGRKGGGRNGNGDWNRGGGDEPPEEAPSFLELLFAAYMRSLAARPVLTKSITTCILALMGDVLAQRLAHRPAEGAFQFDTRRSFAIGTWGLLFMGPVLHTWYSILDAIVPKKFAVFSKLALDQLLFAPFFNASFIVGTMCLEGKGVEKALQTTREKLWTSMKANWMLWPGAQAINFAFVPPDLRVVYVNCVALVWNVILTYISHDGEEERERKEA